MPRSALKIRCIKSSGIWAFAKSQNPDDLMQRIFNAERGIFEELDDGAKKGKQEH